VIIQVCGWVLVFMGRGGFRCLCVESISGV
jgi:hypothetical protein